MGANIKFSRGWERAVKEAVKPQMRAIVDDTQRFFDDFSRRYKGKPVEVIKPALKHAWTQRGHSMSDEKYSEYAKLIRDGVSIKVKLG